MPPGHTQAIFLTLRMTEILQNSAIVTKIWNLQENVLFPEQDFEVDCQNYSGIQKLLSLGLYYAFI